MNNNEVVSKNHVIVFNDHKISRVFHENAWWFVITDVIAALTDSTQSAGYLKDMRRRDPELSKGWGQIATPLSLSTAGGAQKLNCANTEGIFIFSSIITKTIRHIFDTLIMDFEELP